MSFQPGVRHIFKNIPVVIDNTGKNLNVELSDDQITEASDVLLKKDEGTDGKEGGGRRRSRRRKANSRKKGGKKRKRTNRRRK